jgi:hypothetical protein
LKSPTFSTTGANRPDFVSDTISGVLGWPLTRVGGFFSPSDAAPVFENSTAFTNVETSSGRLSRARERHILVVASATTFEHELKVKDSRASVREPHFTESLILAQDERWRRA